MSKMQQYLYYTVSHDITCTRIFCEECGSGENLDQILNPRDNVAYNAFKESLIFARRICCVTAL